MRNEDLSVEMAVKETAGLLATAYQRYLKVVRLTPPPSDEELDNLTKRLPPAALQMLRDFYEARSGTTEAFYFYDPYETSPKFSYDPTGVVTIGRYTVRFNSDWQQSRGPGRSDVQMELLELA